MKRVFSFKFKQRWDGDEAIIHAIEDFLLEDEYDCGEQVRADSKITLLMERTQTSRGTKQ